MDGVRVRLLKLKDFVRITEYVWGSSSVKIVWKEETSEQSYLFKLRPSVSHWKLEILRRIIE